MFKDETIHLLKRLYRWLEVDPSDIDEAKYLLLKRFSEVHNRTLDPNIRANHKLDDLQYR